jgi:hypothetical protein
LYRLKQLEDNLVGLLGQAKIMYYGGVPAGGIFKVLTVEKDQKDILFTMVQKNDLGAVIQRITDDQQSILLLNAEQKNLSRQLQTAENEVTHLKKKIALSNEDK